MLNGAEVPGVEDSSRLYGVEWGGGGAGGQIAALDA